MKTGFSGTFVVPWAQIMLDGTKAPPASFLTLGAEFSWTGTATRIDGPSSVAVLSQPTDRHGLRDHAATRAKRIAPVRPPIGPAPDACEQPLTDNSVTVTDGQSRFVAELLDDSYFVFHGALPPCDTLLWVSNLTTRTRTAPQTPGGVICFSAGSLISTPKGAVPVELLQLGDLVHTRDNGPQPLLWRGAREISGARLYAMPQLRPLRIRAGALGIDRPESDLVVSPDHRLLVSGPAARALFNEPEVLVRAIDLSDLPLVTVDLGVDQVTYIHLAFEHHEILLANGQPSESFDPAAADFSALTPSDRAALVATFPALALDPANAPPPARRVLRRSEAAILGHRLH